MPTISRGWSRASWCARRTPGERITLLDDKEYELDPEFMVIADAARRRWVSRASWAGKGTSIGDSTTDVLLESAHFTPAVVAGRARRLGLFTDAAQRFERGVDPDAAASSPWSGRRRCCWRSRAASRARFR